MAEQDLDGPQVGAGLEQVGGEAVPQGVDGDVLVQAGVLARARTQIFVHGFAGEGPVWDVARGRASRSADRFSSIHGGTRATAARA